MKIFFTFCLAVFAWSTQAQASISGTWNMGTDNTKIEIAKDQGVSEGRIASSDNPKVKIGKLIIKDIKSKSGKWTAKLYSPKKDEWFDADLQRVDNELLVTISSGWMSKTLTWTKE